MTTSGNTDNQSPEQIDVEVSDLDSDLELDELLPTYLKIKGKLYELDPNLVDTTARKQPKGARTRKMAPTQMEQSPTVRKLLSQLQQIASDTLFDEREADAQWPVKRNQIAQDRATKRQSEESQPVEQHPEGEAKASAKPPAPASESLGTAVEPEGSDEETDLLGGMFTAVPNEPSSGPTESDAASSENVTLRDFGKSSGLTPRRLLEEAVRSRLVSQIKFFTQVITPK
jgi:ATP-dependent RNA helicase DHX29